MIIKYKLVFSLSEKKYFCEYFIIFLNNVKIFQVITVSEFGGAQTVVANLAEKLGDKQTFYILYGGEGEAWAHLDSTPNFIRISEHRKNISYKDLILAFKLFRLRCKYRPDIVHLHSSKMGAIGRIVFNPKTIVYTVHGFDSIRKGFSKFLIIEKLLKSRAARIVGVSKYDIEALREEGITSNVELIYNGVIDHSSDLAQDVNEPIIKRLDSIKENYSNIVMCISRISPQKKFDLFLEIAKLRKDIAFVWIGNKEKILDLPDNVFCLGESPFAYIYLNYADIFLLPSNYEGLPMSILEALSYGVPVVASSVGGISEVLNGTNGFAVDNNALLFTEKIDYILNPYNFENMKKQARQSYLNNYTVDKMASKYEAVYKAIIEERKR